MNGKNKDIDPQSELVEEDEAATLPELEDDIADEGASDGAGRAVIVR